MGFHWFRRGLLGLVAALALGILFPLVALAHEPRDVGKYHVLVGWVNEPAIQGQPNAISIQINDKATGQPIDGAEKTLKVAVAFGGGQPRPLELVPSDDVKGFYTASLIPTKVGSYVFTFTGSIDGQPFNQQFESGPGRFDDVTSPVPMEFPVKVPATADLAAQTQAANSTAQAALQRATLLGTAGIVAGVLGIVFGGIALIIRSRPTYVEADSADSPRRSSPVDQS